MSTNTTPRSTRSAAKALVATGLGVVLLAGAGGTFALWSDQEVVSAGTISNGSLSLDTTAGTWTEANGTPIADIATYRMVPGDTVVFEAEVTPTIVGDNLQATLKGELAGSGAHWAVTPSLPGGSQVLTEADSGIAHDLSVTVSLPTASGNDSQTEVLDLGSLTLTLQQVEPTPAP
ncbi:alternate-type signal peptide domain-containing protein [Ornithinicoccus halotolerans]|uniref:alternate-type signal peptide domain-containing protein n=1 Tax=Ornithinicoccus halotolerans TaxID=1748220 RepID=UPI001294B9CF|nr:alternate-type signal peptide domain-containing protein [Ornithinicoccus halotolerans]